MKSRLKRLSATGEVLALCLVVTLAPASARKKKPSTKASAIPQMSQDEKYLHVLNRLAFGPRPGEEDEVRSLGIEKWIDAQLHPASIVESAALEARLQPLDTLRMSAAEMVAKYPPSNVVKQMVDGKIPWPTDPETRVIVQRAADRYRDKEGLSKDDPLHPVATLEEVLTRLPEGQQHVLRSGKPEEKAAVLQTLPLQDQFDVLAAMNPGQRSRISEAAPNELRRRIRLFSGTLQLVNQDLFDAKIFRAVCSNRQLEEVLTDFWYNHFNVHLDKGGDRYLVTSYERDSIRPLVLGKFQALLLATAESPAMLYYLDNFQSVGPDAPASRNPANKNKRGLNENYGRELLELHTLGVDGGYTQHDVTEVARCFTGWTIREPRKGGDFEFNVKQHDQGEKQVLGVTIAAGGGMDDGLKVIEILAHHPATARFISKSLAIRFVADEPPPALVDRMAVTFQRTDGDLREVMRTMIDAPEFWAESAYRGKIKSPFEMVVSALRATDAQVEFTSSLVGQLTKLGEPVYRKQEPTGYSNKGSDWMNSAALLGRMNFALNLSANSLAGVKVTLPDSVDADVMAQKFLGVDLTADSRQVVENGLKAQLAASLPSALPDAKPVLQQGLQPVNTGAPPHAPTPALVAGLTLGSPDFQRR